MLSKLNESKGYLIDGYPREVAQGQDFEAEILPCTRILYFDVSDDCMIERLLNRGKSSGRVDDNEETIKKRLNTFHEHSKPVIEAYKEKCVCVRVLPLHLALLILDRGKVLKLSTFSVADSR